MMRSLLLVGAGGFIGSIARYALSTAINRCFTHSYPLATFTINMLGCFFIGILFGLSQRNSWMEQDGWQLLAIGLCGGFTTFSAFALEGNMLLQKQLFTTASLYALLSVVLGIAICRAGIWLAD